VWCASTGRDGWINFACVPDPCAILPANRTGRPKGKRRCADVSTAACLDDAHCLSKDAQLLYDGNVVQGFRALRSSRPRGLPVATTLTHGIVVA